MVYVLMKEVRFSHKITEDGCVHATMGRNAIILGVDMSSSIHATNRANHIYVMGEGFVQGIHDTTMQKRTISEILQILVKNL